MRQNEIEHALVKIIEKLASIEHERWASWQRYLHGKGERLADGSILLGPELVQHWERQINTEYEMLSEKEKESDREQVWKYIPTIIEALTSDKR